MLISLTFNYVISLCEVIIKLPTEGVDGEAIKGRTKQWQKFL